MRNQTPDAMTATRIRRRATVDFEGAGAQEPPAPLDMFARLGVLVIVALCFGLAAQFLIGVPH